MNKNGEEEANTRLIAMDLGLIEITEQATCLYINASLNVLNQAGKLISQIGIFFILKLKSFTF